MKRHLPFAGDSVGVNKTNCKWQQSHGTTVPAAAVKDGLDWRC